MSALFLPAFVTLVCAVFLFTWTLGGQPPLHCHYLVAVKNTPGVYACSEYPRVKAKP